MTQQIQKQNYNRILCFDEKLLPLFNQYSININIAIYLHITIYNKKTFDIEISFDF